MIDSLRLYLESVVSLATAAKPSTMADSELIGVVGLLPPPAVGYAEWVEKTGVGKEVDSEPVTENDTDKNNDNLIEHARLMRLKNGNGTTE